MKSRIRFWVAATVTAAAVLAVTLSAPAAKEAKATRETKTQPAAAQPKKAKAVYQGKASEPFVNAKALRLAIEDLARTYPDKYTRGEELLKKVADLEARAAGKEQEPTLVAEFRALQREALLANPLLDFDKLLVVKRADGEGKSLGLPQNWQGNCALGNRPFDNEIAVLSPVGPQGKLTTLFKPEKPAFVGDVDLNWDADKMLFSMPKPGGRWGIWEINADGTGLRHVTAGMGESDCYDPCYLPDGRILFDSTAIATGVPCVSGGTAVANLFRMDADGKNIRQICFDQEHDWCPTVLNDGRVMYSRWEYTDTPHYFTRLLFRMNPDGTGQAEYYGSNSYWPNSIFYARPIPNHPSKVVAVVSGHHGVPRMGEMVIFDPGKGKQEAQGAVQRIPGYEKTVDPVIADGLVNASWPKFLHPYPLSEKHFLVSCKPNPTAPWGIYLVDTFDNMVLLCEQPGYAMLEPVPFRKTPRPPVIPDRVNLDSKQAVVYMTDVYAGKGMAGVPRGTVKSLRIFEYHFAYRGMGGHINVGIDGPWDVRRILGTVPVNEDGSAAFNIPANTPVAVQPLDADGHAVQVMRSWFVGMPGEQVSCVGCHEKQTSAPLSSASMALAKGAVDITPWYGPARGFSFKREVQPVLDKYCIGCHNGEKRSDGLVIPNFALTDTEKVDYSKNKAKPRGNNFTSSYVALHPYVRRPGPESDYHVPVPMEWHVSTSPLVQMLQKGHHNVTLDKDAWDHLTTWIDLNVPDHGTWGEHKAIAGNYHAQRMETRAKYAGMTEDPEVYPTPDPARPAFVKPPAEAAPAAKIACEGWPFAAAEAKKKQEADGLPKEITLDLGDKAKLTLVLVPAGRFVMGDAYGSPDERPQSVVAIDKPFYMGKLEISNAQYAAFDAAHDSGVISRFGKDHSKRGEYVNLPEQPAVRVSWKEAMAFCQWLSEKSGRKFTLPSEAQWEWACRAGTDSPLWFGAPGADFGKLANLADKSFTLQGGAAPDWFLKVATVNDGSNVTAACGKYAPNAFGLCDMHGNAAEWTVSTYKPYPYDPADGRDKPAVDGLKVVRGGSFFDRPAQARSAFRRAYQPWQQVFDVGFRVICPAETDIKQTANK